MAPAISVTTGFTGYSYQIYDCRAFSKELVILEDHLCFETAYWVWIIVILMAVTFCLLYFMIWTACYAICEAEAQYGGLTVMQPKEQMVNINEQEMIPTI